MTFAPRLLDSKQRPWRATAGAPVMAIGVAMALWAGAAAVAQTAPAATSGSRAAASAPRGGDHIVAVIGQELVTALEVSRRMEAMRDDARQRGATPPGDAELRKMALEALIDERVMLVHAREYAARVDEAELDRAVQMVATSNKLTVSQLRDRLRSEGMDYPRFRAQLRDQIMLERVREREMAQRIKISDAEVDEVVAKQRGTNGAVISEPEFNIAQILVSVPEGADEATVNRLRAKAEGLLARVKGRESFAVVARDASEDSNRAEGGEIGLRAKGRLPDAFVEVASKLKVGEVAPAVLRTGAGFHVLKLIERRDAQTVLVTQTRARHILLRPSSQSSPDAIQRQLLEMKRQIESGARRFEDLAKQFSADGSAEQGGDLGFVAPGTFVPEFELAMNALKNGEVSRPVVSRFGVHLIQVVERKDVQVDVKQLREQARNVLREQRFEAALADWVKELRSRAYIEMREAP